jgi:phage terminase large subunit-like protein
MPPRLHPAERYARDVLNGKIPACHWIQRACQRYFDDLAHAKERGLFFDKARAQLVIDAIEILPLSEGEFTGQDFKLFGWELFIVWNVFGWYRAPHKKWLIKLPNGGTEDTSGTRRFRVAYIEVGSKNGKTSLFAALGDILAFADNESSSEVYSVANSRFQAKICWTLAKRMMEDSEFFRLDGGVQVLANNINQPATRSKFEPLSSDYNSLDGLNIHAAICDEVHEWPNRELYDKIRQKTSARRNPIIFMITTAGSDTQSFCYGQREYTCKVLDGIVPNDEWFGMIYTIDEGDEPFEERNWFKANPSLGQSKKVSDMRTLAQVAKEIPTERNAFLRYQLNVWVRADIKWMDMDAWRLSTGPVPASAMESFLLTRTCYGGLDLAFSQDLAACVYVFPPQEIPEPKSFLETLNDAGIKYSKVVDRLTQEKSERYYALCRFFCPEDRIIQRARNDRVPYDVWADQGWLIPTPGDFIDHKFIFAHIQADREKFNIKEMAFDRYGAEWIQNALTDLGLTMVQFGQGYVSMSPPMKDLQVLIGKHQLAHGDNPILTWNADNVIATMDPAGNIKPDKQKSREKIDGIVALIMALSRAMVHDPNAGKSIYETRGILTI